MKPGLTVLLGSACFAGGLATGLMWNRDLAPSPGTPLSAKAPPAPERRKIQRGAGPTPGEGKVKERVQAAAAENRELAVMQARQQALERIKPLVDDALQLDDEAKRLAAIEAIRRTIGSADPGEALAGLTGLGVIQNLAFDRGPFREVLKPHLESGDEAIRISAWYGMIQCGLQAEDIGRLRRVAREQGCGHSTAHLLFMAEKGDLTGESGEIVRDLVRSDDPQVKRRAMNGIWGGKFSPELEAEIIALSRQPEYEHDAIYFSLSTQSNKSAATVDRLIEALAHPDSHNTGGRAAWGLQQGVPKELAPRVADAAIKVVGSRTSGYLWEQSWLVLRNHAGRENLEALRQLAAKPGIEGEKRIQLGAMIANLEGAAADE